MNQRACFKQLKDLGGFGAVCLLVALCLLIWPMDLHAQSGRPESGEQKEQQVLSDASAETQPRFVTVLLEAQLGAGGLFSNHSQSAEMLFSAGAGLGLGEDWSLWLNYGNKFHPWEDATSSFHTAGIEVRYRLVKGLYLGAGGGVAWSYLAKDGYQESRIGAGWLLRLGYVHYFNSTVGLTAHVLLHQRWIRQLYTDFGALFGPALKF